MKFIYSSFYHLHPFEDQLPVNLLDQLVNALHLYRRGQGFESPTRLNFLRLSFRNCKSCVYNCDGLLYIKLFIPQFKYMKFIYSSIQKKVIYTDQKSVENYHRPILNIFIAKEKFSQSNIIKIKLFWST